MMFETLISLSTRASGDNHGNRSTAGTAMRVAAKLLRALIDGSFGEQVNVLESILLAIHVWESNFDGRILHL